MGRTWTTRELLVAMSVYCKLPFGKFNHTNTFIKSVAEKLERTPSSLSMKLCNLASFDPALQARGVKGLRAASRADRAIWDAFHANWNEMSLQSEAAFQNLMAEDVEGDIVTRVAVEPTGPSEAEQTVRVRRHQRFFRDVVLSSYEWRCAISLIAVPELLTASHIIPWSENAERRTDPTNGLCLNTLYDRAFDRGFITFDEDYRLVISSRLKKGDPPDLQIVNFSAREGSPMNLPHRFRPDQAALELHRSNVFIA